MLANLERKSVRLANNFIVLNVAMRYNVFMEQLAINIKHFGDYRDFLKCHFNQKKKVSVQFSYGMWARKLGLSSTSSLTKIINGQRIPGPSIQKKLIEYFELNEMQSAYFEDLVRLHKYEDDIQLKVLLMEKMGREHPDAKLTVLDNRSDEVISHWFCLAIREMTNLSSFKEDTKWIQKNLVFDISEERIQWAIELLLHQGLIARVGGRLRPSKGLLHTTNDKASLAIKQYHTQMLDNAKLSLENTPVEFREITAETLSIKLSKLPEAKQLIRNFKMKFLRLMEEQESDETYQIQIQLFPLTKLGENQNEN